MGNLASKDLPFVKVGRLLWEEIRDGTIVWRPPTPAEKVERAERRRELFENSHVPWIVNDVGALAGFYDDVQDIVSFSKWSGRLAGVPGLADLMKRKALGTSDELADGLKAICAGGRRAKGGLGSAAAGWQLQLGLPLALLLRYLPKSPVLMFGLLAGQVANTLFGVGLSLGPVVGASLELTFRGLSALGFPFGADHNKAHQLARARVLEHADRGIGAMQALPWDDRLLGLVGTSLALRDLGPVPEVVLRPQDVPSLGDLVSDPFDTIKTLGGMASALLPNAAAYLVNDFIQPATNALSKLLGGDGGPPPTQPSPELKAAQGVIHRKRCPNSAVCPEMVDALLKFWTWASGSPVLTTDIGHFELVAEAMFAQGLGREQ